MYLLEKQVTEIDEDSGEREREMKWGGGRDLQSTSSLPPMAAVDETGPGQPKPGFYYSIRISHIWVAGAQALGCFLLLPQEYL